MAETAKKEPAAQIARIISLKALAGGKVPGPPDAAVPAELPEDPWAQLEGQVLSPPFNLTVLAGMPENGSELGSCIEAMVTNIDSFGHRLEPRSEVDDETPDKIKKDLRNEERRAWNFFTNCTYDNMTFTMARRRMRKDLEATGNGYWEVIAKPSDPARTPVGVNHIPSQTVRLLAMDIAYTPYEEPYLEWVGDHEYHWKTRTAYKRFRRYVQIKEGKKVYFKEFGDPRHLHRETGEYETAEKPVPVNLRGTELIHFKLYCSSSPYGVPRWMGALFCVYGTRAADEINYVTFKNNHVPSMAILVSNGQLTQESIERVTEYIQAQVAGDDNRSKFVVIEGEPATEGLKESPNVKIDIKPLREVQQSDAMFVQYTKGNNERTRRSFRLPPLLVGAAEEYTRATADAARRVADEQVFQPERDEFDSTMDRTLLARLRIAAHHFKSNSPATTDTTELVNILAQSERTGGLTPNLARMIISSIFGRSLGRLKKTEVDGTTFDPDMPFTLTLAQAVKNAGPVRQGTLPYNSKPAEDKGDVPGAAEPNRITSQKAATELADLLQETLVRYLGKDLEVNVLETTDSPPPTAEPVKAVKRKAPPRER